MRWLIAGWAWTLCSMGTLVAQQFGGVYSASPDTATVVTLMLRQDAANKLTGTLAARGESFPVEGMVEDGAAIGAIRTGGTGFYFEAQLRNDQLELTIVDVDRAGDYEPWRGVHYQDTRIVRDIYPPRMTVQYKRYDGSGALVAEGERKLSDLGFLLGPNPINSSDPLRYEKRMIDSWLRREDGLAAR